MRATAQELLAIGIDYQEKLIPAMHEKEQLIKNSSILLAGLNLLEVPVIVSRQYPQGIGDTVAPICEVTGGAKVYDKTTFSCCHTPAIKQAIAAYGRRKILLCGTEAHVCVLQTAIDLLADGYQVYYVTDCVGSRKAMDKKFGIKRAAQEGARLTTYEAILFELTANTANPAFKGISNLVK